MNRKGKIMIQFLCDHFWWTILIGFLVVVVQGLLIAKNTKKKPEISNKTFMLYEGSTNGRAMGRGAKCDT